MVSVEKLKTIPVSDRIINSTAMQKKKQNKKPTKAHTHKNTETDQ